MSSEKPLISAVIPTRNRPALVLRAVRSALNQTERELEAVVVVDGPDETTVRSLAEIDDPRLRVISLARSVGAQEARNAGVRESRGTWVAFLDDDDEWLPTKLERQVAAALASEFRHPIVSCGLVAQTPSGNTRWPRREPRRGESVAEYLFLRSFRETAEIRLQTSTLMASRELLVGVPWRTGPNDEWDLLLRAARVEGAGLVFVMDPLAIWHSDAGIERISLQPVAWHHSLEWFQSVRPLIGPRAYASFVLSAFSAAARRAGDWSAFFGLLWLAVRHGQPTLWDLAGHVGRWLVPGPMKRALTRSG